MKSAFIIAAPTSGSGKTTLSRGLMALLSAKGYRVQPFKCGPDYIDTKFHEAACGRASINLDSFMASPDHVRRLFARYGSDADVCVVEGMMGLFDGYDRDRGSSAEIARILQLPVVLVVDAKSAAYSMAALLSGFLHFCRDIHIAGIIFNKVGSSRHAAMLRQVCDDLQVPCFGYLPKDASLEQGSRYLGLDFSQQPAAAPLTALLSAHLALPPLLAATATVEGSFAETGIPAAKPLGTGEGAFAETGIPAAKPLGTGERAFAETGTPAAKPLGTGAPSSVLVARNAESFSFLYQETLDGYASVRFFDPEREVPELADTDLLYLPGGYPEKHLPALVANEACRQAIKAFADGGGHILAECGGMMYLCQHIVTDEGSFPMCGVLPYTITARQADRKLSLGYRRFTLGDREYRGHEFHYTTFMGEKPQSAVQVYNAQGQPVDTPVFLQQHVMASYTHLYPSQETSGEGRPAAGAKGRPAAGSFAALHPLMLAGTGSDVGKSIVAAAFCRIFRQDGYHPAPFKAQNMALNSYATPEGLEIGRAQAVQAEAAGIACHTDMNPLLLKPQSDHTSQVVLNGKPLGNKNAYDYWRGRKSGPQDIDFRAEVCAAFDRLAARYNPIVMEGAGSISEINLRSTDLVNMPMARHAQADVILVGDIDRGGIFASVYGSVMLQTPEDRRRIKGIIINKFRGDMRLFDEGRRMLEDLCGIPVLGVIPYYKDIHIEEEDSVALAKKSFERQQGKVNIAVVMLQHLSNYTDFDALEQDARVHLFYTNNEHDLLQADIIIVPGTKSTLHDLYELRRNGCAQAIVKAHRQGCAVLGICGGYQLMGIEVCDPDHVEGDIDRLPGLGLLPVSTTMSGEKRTVQVHCEYGSGYEIHMGETRPMGDAPAAPLLHLSDGRTDGYLVDNKCMGTYVHGILDNQAFVDFLLQPFADKVEAAGKSFDYAAFKEEQYDKLADHVRRHVDMERIYQILTAEEETAQ